MHLIIKHHNNNGVCYVNTSSASNRTKTHEMQKKAGQCSESIHQSKGAAEARH
jgi:hypothetical protein